jgi:hypothetical protein
MKKEYKNINRFFRVVSRALFRSNSTLDYSRTIEAISRLAEVVHSTETEEDVWWIGECSDASLDSIIVGAYWFVYDFCSDDPIKFQRIATNLSDVFKPGCTTGPEKESCEQDVYDALERMYKEYNDLKNYLIKECF